MKVFKVFSVSLCVFMVMVLLGTCAFAALEQGVKAPDFSGVDQNGKTVTKDYFKNQNILLYFIKYPGDAAKEEFLAIQDFKNFFNVLIVACTEEGYNDTVAYLKKKGLSYPVVFDNEKRIQDLYRINYQFPTLYIIDNNGNIADSRIGFIEPLESFAEDYLKKFGLSIDYTPAEAGKPWIGLLVIELPGYLEELFSVDKGLYVGKVMPGSPAQAAGFAVGDIMTEFDGKVLEDEGDVTNIIDEKKAGDVCAVKYIRKKPEKLTLAFTKQDKAGWEIDDMPSALEDLYKADKGVIVKKVENGSPAEAMGFKAFDLLVSADNVKIGDEDQLKKIIEGKKAGEEIVFSVVRLENEVLSSSVTVGVK